MERDPNRWLRILPIDTLDYMRRELEEYEANGCDDAEAAADYRDAIEEGLPDAIEAEIARRWVSAGYLPGVV